MQLLHSYTGAEAKRFAQEPPPYGAGWPNVAHEVDVIFVYQKELDKPSARFWLMLA